LKCITSVVGANVANEPILGVSVGEAIVMDGAINKLSPRKKTLEIGADAASLSRMLLDVKLTSISTVRFITFLSVFFCVLSRHSTPPFLDFFPIFIFVLDGDVGQSVGLSVVIVGDKLETGKAVIGCVEVVGDIDCRTGDSVGISDDGCGDIVLDSVGSSVWGCGDTVLGSVGSSV
jgi:hypothetical protein